MSEGVHFLKKKRLMRATFTTELVGGREGKKSKGKKLIALQTLNKQLTLQLTF